MQWTASRYPTRPLDGPAQVLCTWKAKKATAPAPQPQSASGSGKPTTSTSSLSPPSGAATAVVTPTTHDHPGLDPCFHFLMQQEVWTPHGVLWRRYTAQVISVEESDLVEELCKQLGTPTADVASAGAVNAPLNAHAKAAAPPGPWVADGGVEDGPEYAGADAAVNQSGEMANSSGATGSGSAAAGFPVASASAFSHNPWDSLRQPEVTTSTAWMQHISQNRPEVMLLENVPNTMLTAMAPPPGLQRQASRTSSESGQLDQHSWRSS